VAAPWVVWFNEIMQSDLIPFLRPAGVVVIGASTSPDRLGHGIARNLIASNYKGAIHFVGQREGRLFDRPVYDDVSRVPDPVDLAVVVIPPGAVAAALDACGRRGIRAAIVISAGFKEAGAEGAALEERCLEVARSHQLRILGPNCIGTMSTHLPLDTTFLQPPMPPAGSIGFVSHSGALCAAIIDWARGQGIGFSQVVSLGNQSDVNEIDLLPALCEDKQTRVVVMYLEGISDGRRFVQLARQLSSRTPLIALKVGASESGRRAAASHTGAMAGSDRAYTAAFEKAGVLRATDTAEGFDWAKALSSCPPLPGRNIAVLTNAGGPGVIAVDALAARGMHLTELAAATRAELAASLPPAASVANPVDMLASARPVDYASSLAVLLRDKAVDGVLVISPPPPMYAAEALAEALSPVIRAAKKPVLMVLMGSELTKGAFRLFAEADIPVYEMPERAASAFLALARYQELARRGSPPTAPPANWRPLQPGTALNEETLARACNIPRAERRLALSDAEAAGIASAIGFPVVLKIASPDIPHKSDIGAVLQDLQDEAGVVAAYSKVRERVLATRPEARIEGVYVERQVGQGQDVILGALQDPDFGPLMMFGSGGIEVEGLRDTSFALAPLSDLEAHDMLQRTWAGRRLAGYRSLPPADEKQVVEALVALSWLAHEQRNLEEIEINPLRVLEPGLGVVALDVRYRLRSQDPDSP